MIQFPNKAQDRMVRRIYKYPIPNLADRVEIGMPGGAQIIHVGQQAGVVTLWALVDPDEPYVLRTIRVVGTGHDIRYPHGKYLGTVQVPVSTDLIFDVLVWHLFDQTLV